MSMPLRVGGIRLGGNENPFGPSVSVLEAIRSAGSSINRYPDSMGTALKEALAVTLHCQPNRIVLGNGSDELIHLLGLAYLNDPKDEVLTGNPSFFRYDAVAEVARCQMVKVALDEGHRLDLAAISERANDRTKLIFVSNPNNPTGTTVNRAALESLLASVTEDAVIVLDEAYFEFACSDPDYPNGVELGMLDDRIVVLRTFSKAYGLAGLRIGYAVAAPGVAQKLELLRSPFNVNTVAQAAAIAALQDGETLARTQSANQTGLIRLQSGLRDLGFTPSDSRANFAYFVLGMDADPVIRRLAELGIQVRGGSATGTLQGLRVGVGLPDETDAFLEAFKCVLGEFAN